MAQQPHEPTKETRSIVKMAAAIGRPQERICARLGISRPTLEKHYREELDHGLEDMLHNVGGRLYQAAMDGDVSAMIFIMKCRGRWKPPGNEIETGGDIHVTLNYVDKQLNVGNVIVESAPAHSNGASHAVIEYAGSQD